MMSFWVTLLTSKGSWKGSESDMATSRENIDGQRQEDGGGYIPIGRVGNRITNWMGRRRPPSPSHPGRGLLAFPRGRERGLRPFLPLWSKD